MSDLEKNSLGEPSHESREEATSVSVHDASVPPRGVPPDPDAHLSRAEKEKIVSSVRRAGSGGTRTDIVTRIAHSFGDST